MSTAPPPPTQPAPQAHRPHLRTRFKPRPVRQSLALRATKFVCSVVVSLVLVAGVLLFILWLALRPHRPRFHVTAFSVPAVPSGSISFQVSDRNPNRNIGIYYDSVAGSVYYSSDRIGSNLAVAGPFYQPPKSTKTVQGAVAVAAAPVAGAVAAELAESGRVGFRLELRSRIRFRLKTWWEGKHWHPMHVSCDVEVGPDGEMMAESREKRCSIYFL